MSATCPVCQAQQAEGLLCHNCTSALERELGDVAAIVAELDITLSRQARIGSGGDGKMGKGWAREKLPIHIGAIEAADVLTNTLTTWARDITEGQSWEWVTTSPAIMASHMLLSNIPAIRRHPAVVELVDEITDAIRKARHTIDKPADRKFFGTCLAEFPDPEGRLVTCLEEIWASLTAREVTCRVCGIEHEIEERRDWMLAKAEDMLFAVKDAAQIVGSYGQMDISESTIRSYISSGQIAYHGKVEGQSVIRLGDLFAAIRNRAAKNKGRKLKRAS